MLENYYFTNNNDVERAYRNICIGAYTEKMRRVQLKKYTGYGTRLCIIIVHQFRCLQKRVFIHLNCLPTVTNLSKLIF